MDFDKILVDDKDIRRLRKIAKSENGLPNVPDDSRLRNQWLISCDYRELKPRYSRITPDGRDYLLWLDIRKREKRSERRHSWAVAVFSVIAGAVLSRPLWETIDQIRSFLSNLP